MTALEQYAALRAESLALECAEILDDGDSIVLRFPSHAPDSVLITVWSHDGKADELRGRECGHSWPWPEGTTLTSYLSEREATNNWADA